MKREQFSPLHFLVISLGSLVCASTQTYADTDQCPEGSHSSMESTVIKKTADAINQVLSPTTTLKMLLDSPNPSEKDIIKAVTDVYFDTPEGRNALFQLGGNFLRKTRSAKSYDKTMLKIFKVLKKYPGLLEDSHGAVLFHGSRSASLIALTDYSGKEKGLLPTGLLLKKGKVPFTGNQDPGAEGVGNIGLSTIFINRIDVAVGYSGYKQDASVTDEKPWNPKLSEERLKKEQLSDIEESVEKQRQKQWSHLTPEEQNLVAEHFPIVYGIMPKKEVIGVRSQKYEYEMAVPGGAAIEEVRSIFVPPNKVKQVETLLLKHNVTIPVKSLETISPKQSDQD